MCLFFAIVFYYELLSALIIYQKVVLMVLFLEPLHTSRFLALVIYQQVVSVPYARLQIVGSVNCLHNLILDRIGLHRLVLLPLLDQLRRGLSLSTLIVLLYPLSSFSCQFRDGVDEGVMVLNANRKVANVGVW
ncbi:uncharacterized protein LOC111892614 [Lactuca sativa]|uniref:uncharacterized protein LOC111892614 n=1 Tax=Lactuca sativa TaxID=4236 RepID=UPI000CD8EDB8|nr:uncharacterized protein LOC111892614 [Lactuca sativa]